MSKLPFDFSKLKKVAQDKHSATFAHKDGHEIKIAMSALKGDMKQQLMDLPLHKAEGGEANSSNQKAALKENTKCADCGRMPCACGKDVKAKPVKMYAEGSPTDDASSPPPDAQAAPAPAQQPVINVNVGGQSPAAPPSPNGTMWDTIGKVAHGVGQLASKAAAPLFPQRSEQEIQSAVPQGAPAPVAAAPQPMPQPAPVQQPVAQEAAPEEQAEAPAKGPAPASSLADDKSPASIDQSAVAEAPPAEPSPSAPATDQAQPQQAPDPLAAATDTTLSPLQRFQAVRAVAKDDALAEDNKMAQDLVNGHITPKTYHDLFASRSTLGKIGTIFGMLLGGLGSGMTGQPNVLMSMMDKTIANDLEAQRQSKTNALNLLNADQTFHTQKANIEQMVQNGKLTAATAKQVMAATAISQDSLAHMRANRIAFHDQALRVQQLEATRLPNDPELVAAKQGLAMMGQAVDMSNANYADKAAAATAYAHQLFGQPAGQGQASGEDAFQQKMAGLRMLGPQGEARAKDLEAKHIPGFSGQASETMSDTHKKELKGMALYDQQLARFTEWAKAHSGILPTSPANIAIINQGKTLAKALQSTYRENSLNTVYRPGEQGLLSETIPDNPAKFLNKFRVLPQLQALREENKAKLNDAAKLEGLGGYEGFGDSAPPTQDKQAAPSGPREGATGTFKGKPVIFKGGKWSYK